MAGIDPYAGASAAHGNRPTCDGRQSTRNRIARAAPCFESVEAGERRKTRQEVAAHPRDQPDLKPSGARIPLSDGDNGEHQLRVAESGFQSRRIGTMQIAQCLQLIPNPCEPIAGGRIDWGGTSADMDA